MKRRRERAKDHVQHGDERDDVRRPDVQFRGLIVRRVYLFNLLLRREPERLERPDGALPGQLPALGEEFVQTQAARRHSPRMYRRCLGASRTRLFLRWAAVREYLSGHGRSAVDRPRARGVLL